MQKSFVTLILFAMAVFSVSAQTTEKLALNGSVGKLSAVLQKPNLRNGEKADLVIILHGFSAKKEMPILKDIADDLAKNGIASIRFDFNGHGESEGDFQNMTVLNEIEDAKKVYEYARALPFVRTISLVGHSQGATYNPLSPPEYVTIPSGLKLGKAYIQSAFSLPIYETAKRYQGFACMIHGTGDTIAPYTYSLRYQEVFRNAEIHLIEAEDHNFSKNKAQVVKYAVDFIVAKLKFQGELYL